jgi:AraC-like DNA-binding protein
MKERLKIASEADGFAAPVGPSVRPLPSHHHDELEVNLVLRGHASYLFGNRRVPLRAHSMIWLFPKQEHVLIDWSDDFSMWVIVFKPGLVARYAGSGMRRVLRSADPGDIYCREVDPRRIDLLDAVYQGASRENRDFEFLNAALGYALVASWEAYQFSGESIARTDVHPAVARAARLIASAATDPKLVPLARAAGLSPARLSRLFKRQAGLSLTAFRQRKCLERFLRLYGRGARYTLLEAALEAGFGSYAQFHRVFCRLMKMNPAAYRRQIGAASNREISP